MKKSWDCLLFGLLLSEAYFLRVATAARFCNRCPKDDRWRETEDKTKHFKSQFHMLPSPWVLGQSKMLLHLLFTNKAHNTTCNDDVHWKWHVRRKKSRPERNIKHAFRSRNRVKGDQLHYNPQRYSFNCRATWCVTHIRYAFQALRQLKGLSEYK